ncbi:MAG: acyl-CoA dehydrogenase, partial [Gemmatimonadota bacterium]
MTAGPRGWTGKERRQSDELYAAAARGMAALLDRAPEGFDRGAHLPAGWHWLYFQPADRQSELGPDGHLRRGDFLPPVS